MNAPSSASLDQLYQHTLSTLRAGADLDRATARQVMDALMTGALSEIRAAALLTVLAIKRPSVEALVGLAEGLQARMVPVPLSEEVHTLDTCGTGGSGLDTANTSTAAAFVVAAAGVKVAKHGNRASSGRCGSSDLLEALGVPVIVGPEQAAQLIEEVGLAFLFAPAYHPAVKAVVPVRKALGFRTVFNFLGPLCNPARAGYQVLGVSDPEMAPLMAEVLRQMGSRRALVVHGEDGLDEISLAAATRILDVQPSGVTAHRITPEEVGLDRVAPEALRGGDVTTNQALFEAVLRGEDTPHGRLARLNAGAALLVAGQVDTLQAGVQRADELLTSGAAADLFARYREATRALAAA